MLGLVIVPGLRVLFVLYNWEADCNQLACLLRFLRSDDKNSS